MLAKTINANDAAVTMMGKCNMTVRVCVMKIQ